MISALLLTAALIQAPAPRSTAIAVERSLAGRLGLEVGDTVRLGVAPDSLRALAVVAAIYEPRPDPAELSRQGRRVRMHLPDLAALLDAPYRVDRFGIADRRPPALADLPRFPGDALQPAISGGDLCVPGTRVQNIIGGLVYLAADV